MDSIYKIIDDRGRITIPQEIRTATDINKGDVIKISIKGKQIVLTKVGIVDYKDFTSQELLTNIHNALNYLDKDERIEVIKNVLKALERND